MPPFRFNIPFFSYGSPSRPSSGTSSPSPPPTPSRPPFRPGGIAQPSKPATSLETKPKVSPSLSRAKSNVAATAASSSASQLPSRGAATPTRLAKQSNQSSSPLKKPDSLRAEEQKVAAKDKPSRGVEKEAGENMNPVVEKPPIARSKQKEAEEAQEQRKRREVEKLAVVERNSKTTQEQQRKETEKLAAEEKKKLLDKDMEGNLKIAQGEQMRKETDKLAAEEKKKVLGKDMEENSKTTQAPQKRKETEQLAVGESKKVLGNDMEENSKTAQEQQKRKETEEKRKEDERLSAEEEKKVLGKDMEENSKQAQEQEKRKEAGKLAVDERNRALKTVGKEDETQSKTTRHIAAASESTRGPIDLLPDRKTQNKTGIHNNDNHQRGKGESTSNHGNPRVANREGSSSMSRRIKEDIRDGISKLTWGKSNGDEKSVSVFTLTGENRGATMAVGSEKDKKDGEVHIHRGYRSNPDESPDTTATETEGGTRPFKGENPKDEDKEDARVRAYVNGNSQGVNNSIVCDSSVQQNDPGIHMSLKFEISKKKNEAISPPEKKSETVTATEKLKHEPRVRRRCLRGLLAESSESEPENPSKPRRHGCRFTCKDKDIENT